MIAPDFGPLYRETDFSGFPVEPWNTASAFIFLFVALYWLRRLRRDPREHRFLARCLPLLLLGFVGGALYHATRSHPLWLLLDVIPIGVLGVAAAAHLWRRLGASPGQLLLALGLPLGTLGLGAVLCGPGHLATTLAYIALALPVASPLLALARRCSPRERLLAHGALAAFVTALLMRSVDLFPHVPAMGAHFLWHLFGGLAVHLLIAFLFHGAPESAGQEAIPSRENAPADWGE